MSQLPSTPDLLHKIFQLQSYIQTLQKTNQSKNSQLTLLRKKVQLLKDQNIVLKLQSKNTSHDKYLTLESYVVELEEKLEVAMEQCIVYKTENQKLKREVMGKYQSKGKGGNGIARMFEEMGEDDGRLLGNRMSYSTTLRNSPQKLSYPISMTSSIPTPTSILKNKPKDKPKESPMFQQNSTRFNSIQKRPSANYNSQRYSTTKTKKQRDGLTEECLDYNKQGGYLQHHNTPLHHHNNKFDTENLGRVFTMIDGNVSFSNLHGQGNTVKRNRSSISNSSSKKERVKMDSNKSYMFTEGECQALGKIIDQLRDGQRKVKMKY